MHKACEKLRLQIRQVHEGRYLLGLSGGADSTMLLTLLAPDAREGRIRLEAVHVNHGLRGAESDEDERFCRELCEKEGVPLTAYRAELDGRKDEASARMARFAFFRERYLETGADALILAHNADDQAETFLMRLLRGAGPEGLECMREDEETEGIRILRGTDKILGRISADPLVVFFTDRIFRKKRDKLINSYIQSKKLQQHDGRYAFTPGRPGCSLIDIWHLYLLCTHNLFSFLFGTRGQVPCPTLTFRKFCLFPLRARTKRSFNRV